MVRLLMSASLGMTLLLSFIESSSAATLSGTVTINGKPGRNTRLYVSGVQKPIRADKNGLFSVTAPSSGTVTITPVPKSRLVATPLRRTVTVSGSDITGLNFSVSPLAQKVALQGRITDRAGAPVPNVAIYISGIGRIFTDANGVYARADLQPGRYNLSASAQQVTFTPALRQLRLEAGRGATSRFRARPLEAGVSVATFLSGVYTVSLTRTSGVCSTLPNSIQGVATLTQRDKNVRVSLPNLGTTTLCATTNGFSGEFSRSRLGCDASGNLQAVYSSQDSASLTGNLQIICPGQSNCTGTFSGTLTRQ
ncbi:MAG: hypothetical protein EBZ48_10865 [Proteobacteria bacterium]|nr:hypothetical protein [Pseudomonadota bacterium]